MRTNKLNKQTKEGRVVWVEENSEIRERTKDSENLSPTKKKGKPSPFLGNDRGTYTKTDLVITRLDYLH